MRGYSLTIQLLGELFVAVYNCLQLLTGSIKAWNLLNKSGAGVADKIGGLFRDSYEHYNSKRVRMYEIYLPTPYGEFH
jgi:hypothetical protein